MKLALTNGIILDGTKEMKPVSGKTILISDDKIEDIVTKFDSNEYKVIDLKGKYVMPGLINLHIHLPASGKPKLKQTDPRKLVKILTSNKLLEKIVEIVCYKNALMQLKTGTTTIRTVGGVKNVDSKIRDKINKGKLGPRILASNMAISVPGGHMAGSLGYEATSVESALECLDKIMVDKPDIIKLMITGGVLDAKVKGEPGVLKMPAEYVKAVCDKAHSLGLKVAAHVESPEGVKVALENGVDTIEHGAKPTQEIIDLFKANKAADVVTISPALPYALFDTSVSHASELEKYNGNIVFEGVIDCAKECIKNDIPVGLGTDTGCPYITHYNTYRELVYFVKYLKVKPEFAIYTATLGNAKIAGIDNIVGTIKKGKIADLVVVNENPLENLNTLANVAMVFSKGKQVKNIKVKKVAEVERRLDEVL